MNKYSMRVRADELSTGDVASVGGYVVTLDTVSVGARDVHVTWEAQGMIPAGHAYLEADDAVVVERSQPTAAELAAVDAIYRAYMACNAAGAPLYFEITPGNRLAEASAMGHLAEAGRAAWRALGRPATYWQDMVASDTTARNVLDHHAETTAGNPLPYGRCDTCGKPCDREGCTVDRTHLAGVDPASLPVPAPNRVGELPHAYPREHAEYSTCTVCGAEVFADGADDEGTGIWTHTATLDYFC